MTTGTSGLPVIENVDRTTDLTQTDTTNQNQLNLYNPGQQSLQGQLANSYSGLITGDVPEGFGLPDAVRQKAWLDFNQHQAPLLAARHGAGAPAIDSAAAQLNLGLAAADGQNAHRNAIGAYQAASNMAFQRIGQDNTSSNTRQANEQLGQNTYGVDLGAAAAAILGLLPSPTFPGTGGSDPGGGGTIYI